MVNNVSGVIKTNFFPPRPTLTPAIYAYEDSNPQYVGLFKLGDVEPWTDEKLYVKYGLTQEEIAFIESMIRPMETMQGEDV
jgi:site-specific DNA-methyltransferase (adenine-specific)